MKNSKLRRVLLLAAMSLCMAALLTAGVTLAYFTAADVRTNTFTVGQVDIALTEVQDEENGVLIPGQPVNRDVWVRNEGSAAAWIRVKVYIPSAVDRLPAAQATEGNDLSAFDAVHMRLLPGAEAAWNVEKAYSEAAVAADGEYAGYNEYVFYYDTIVDAGAATEQLLDEVCLDAAVGFDKETGKYFQIIHEEAVPVDLSNLNIIVTAEAIQASGFENWEAAFAAFDVQAAK